MKNMDSKTRQILRKNERELIHCREIGYDELNDIIKLAKNYEYYDIIECIKDYAKNDRVVVCRFHQK